MESIGDESSSLEITPDLGTEESTARDIKVPSQAGHQPLLLLLQNMEMVFTATSPPPSSTYEKGFQRSRQPPIIEIM